MKKEQQKQDQQRQRNDVRLECRRHDLKSLQGGKYGDGRRHHAVSVEHAGAKQTKQHDLPLAPRIAFHIAQGQGNQRHDAAFAAVIGTHDEDDIFDRNDKNQRPDH